MSVTPGKIPNRSFLGVTSVWKTKAPIFILLGRLYTPRVDKTK
jgi:hypothetical protein